MRTRQFPLRTFAVFFLFRNAAANSISKNENNAKGVGQWTGIRFVLRKCSKNGMPATHETCSLDVNCECNSHSVFPRTSLRQLRLQSFRKSQRNRQIRIFRNCFSNQNGIVCLRLFHRFFVPLFVRERHTYTRTHLFGVVFCACTCVRVYVSVFE